MVINLHIGRDRLATRQWVRGRVRVYARRVSLSFIPTVAFGPVHKARAEYLHATRIARFDLQKHLCRHDADDSAAHEVVHARWPNLHHGDTFDRRVLALRSGARCGPRGSRLPEAYR